MSSIINTVFPTPAPPNRPVTSKHVLATSTNTQHLLLCNQSLTLFTKERNYITFQHLPIFPPLAYGASMSTTLIPVSRISCSTLISENAGASAWMAACLKQEYYRQLYEASN